MRFLDSNVVIYAFFKPRRELKTEETALKEKSKKIIERIDGGEKVTLCVVNLSEIANVLKTCFSAQDLAELLETFYTKENVAILSVTPKDYLAAIELSKRFSGKVNDCLIVHLMRQNNLKEIYTFDEDFKQFAEIKIV